MTTNPGFLDAYSYFLKLNIFTPLVEYFKAKNVKVTIDELFEVIGTNNPIDPNRHTVFSQTQRAPVQPVTTEKPVKKTTAVENPIVGVQCMYRFTRGLYKGKCCGKNVAPGTNHCSYCTKTKNIKRDTPSVQPGFSPHAIEKTNEGPRVRKLEVETLDVELGLYLNTATNFVIYRENEGSDSKVISYQDPNTKERRNLTDEEKVIAREMDLVISETPMSENTPESVIEVTSTPKTLQTSSSPFVPLIRKQIPSIPSLTKRT